MATVNAFFIWLVVLVILGIAVVYEISTTKDCPKCGSRMNYGSHSDGTSEVSFLECPVCGHKEVLDERELDK